MNHTSITSSTSSIRLESIVLGEVMRTLDKGNKKILPTREFTGWTRLNLGVLSSMETVGYFPELTNHYGENPPHWTHFASDHNGVDILTGFLVSKGLLDKNDAPLFLTERAPMLTDLVPMVIRRAVETEKLSVEDGLAFLETLGSFNSTLARPVAGSWLDTYCREYPTAPICLVAKTHFRNANVLRERANIGFVALAEHFKLLDTVEAISVLKATYGDYGVIKTNTDITIGDAETIVETANLGEHLTELRHILADARAGYVVDGTWAEIIAKSSTPQTSTLIHQIPIGRALIDNLVKHNLIDAKFIPSMVETLAGAIIRYA